MSKAKLARSLLGDIAPKVAAPIAGGGLMFPSEDAEAGVKLRLLVDAADAYKTLRKQIAQGRQKGLSPQRVAEKFIHDRKITNYDGKFPRDPTGFNGYALQTDGEMAGEYWKGGVQNLYNEILGAVDDPDPMVVRAMDDWLESHVGREVGVSMAENRAKALKARKAAAAAGAAGVAGGANATASPSLVVDGVFQHNATPHPVATRRPEVNNQSEFLEGITDFGDKVFSEVRNASGPVGSLLMPFQGINDYLKVVNDNDRQPTWLDRVGILDF